ncbi:MAG: DNA-binding protein [Bacilli bacterium]|nr:DNA-binding protein [Bacilli bacterium]
MENVLYLTELYDYYSNLFTEKQKSYFEDYYFDNLTMEEIAENNNVSKNAISKTLIEVKEKLIEYESALKLYEKRKKIESLLDDEIVNIISEYI